MLEEFQVFLNSNNIYNPTDILEVLEKVQPYFKLSYMNTVTLYYNVPVSFDIETSSFYQTNGDNQEKVGIMYEWSFGIYGVVIIGRTWNEFIDMISILCHELKLSDNKRLIVYVHNLGYEFQFMRKWFEWATVFSVKDRTPVYALTTSGIEFRCSYLLSGYSLAKVGENLHNYNVKKLVGDLDYDKVRHSKTPLTSTELAYCVNDVKVVMAYIAEKMVSDKDIAHIPLTKTGYVRRYCCNSCFYETGVYSKKSFKHIRYLELMKSMQLTKNEYFQLKDAFQGGFTHANPFYVEKIVEDVTSFDFTSSYPTVMVAEQFPMSSCEIIDIRSKEEFIKNLKLYCCLFDIKFVGLQSKVWFDSYLSLSHCRNVKNVVLNNGRIVSADELITTLTEQDFMIINQFYTWKKIEIGKFRRYAKDYLPTDFVKAILKLYHDKTTLKDVEGKEIEYANGKEMLNSSYGMTVFDMLKDDIIYLNDRKKWLDRKDDIYIPPDYEKKLKKYNNSKSRFIFYPWGIWICSYSRRNLFSGILEFKEDYIYSDTDSIKVINADKHKDYILKYNEMIRNQLYRAMDYHGIDRSAIEPETIEGVKKCLGVWDFDGHYSRFKTLGAKRYAVEYSNDERNKPSKRGTFSITVSGLNKKVCIPYLTQGWSKTIDNSHESNNPFDKFNRNLYIPKEYTGKNTHTYIDNERQGIITDYLGNPCEYYEKSGIHLEKSDYSMKLSKDYSDYLLNINTVEI